MILGMLTFRKDGPFFVAHLEMEDIPPIYLGCILCKASEKQKKLFIDLVQDIINKGIKEISQGEAEAQFRDIGIQL